MDNKEKYIDLFRAFYDNNDPMYSKGLCHLLLDVVLITGDAYIDSPFMGIAVVGRILEDIGLRVGIIGQPDINSDVDIKRLGEPKLFWGVSGGSIDSMVSNYTATKKFRNDDDYTPGGKNNFE